MIQTAAQLALEMARSPQQYHWEWYEDSEWYSRGIAIKQDLERFTVLDIQRHGKIQSGKFADLPADKKIGDLLFVMYPSLFRREKEGQADIQLEKAVIVIRVNQEEPPIKKEGDRFGITKAFKETASRYW